MNVIMLPDDGTNRCKIVKWVAKKYEDKYGDTIITDKWYRKHRQQVRHIVKSVVLDSKNKGKVSAFIGGTYLL